MNNDKEDLPAARIQQNNSWHPLTAQDWTSSMPGNHTAAHPPECPSSSLQNRAVHSLRHTVQGVTLPKTPYILPHSDRIHEAVLLNLLLPFPPSKPYILRVNKLCSSPLRERSGTEYKHTRKLQQEEDRGHDVIREI